MTTGSGRGTRRTSHTSDPGTALGLNKNPGQVDGDPGTGGVGRGVPDQTRTIVVFRPHTGVGREGAVEVGLLGQLCQGPVRRTSGTGNSVSLSRAPSSPCPLSLALLRPVHGGVRGRNDKSHDDTEGSDDHSVTENGVSSRHPPSSRPHRSANVGAKQPLVGRSPGSVHTPSRQRPHRGLGSTPLDPHCGRRQTLVGRIG